MSTGNQMPTFTSFTITQPFLGAPLQFHPALGSKQLEELIDAYVVGNACKQDKLSTVTIDFYNHATVDINTGSLVRRYDVMPSWSFEQSPSQSQSSGLSPPLFTPSPASSATFADSIHGSISTPPNRSKGSRVSKKTKKEAKRSSEIRLPGFSIMTKDGIDVTNSAGRGTKTKEQREHAHLMRIIKACDECKRKKIRCDPSHRSSSHTNISRSSTSTKPSPPSQSNPSPPASTPSLSCETTQGSEKSSTPVDSFSMEDFVLFPEDELNKWSPGLSMPGFDTQFGDFSMSNYNTFPDFDASFPTMDDNSSFDFSSFNQSPSFNTQSFNNTNHMPNYYNTQPLAGAEVNSQHIPQTQIWSDQDIFDSFGEAQNFSPTHAQQAHPQAVADEDPGKINSFVQNPVSRSQAYNVPSVPSVPRNVTSQTNNTSALQDLSTTFGFSSTDSCHQPLAPDYGFVHNGLVGAYDNASGSLESGVETSSQSQTPQSESSDSGLNANKARSRSQRSKHPVLSERRFMRCPIPDREPANAFVPANEEPHVPGATVYRQISSSDVFHGGDRFSANAAKASRDFDSCSSPVHEETPWSFESPLSSSNKSRPQVAQETADSTQGGGVLSVKRQVRTGASARPSLSAVVDGCASSAVRLASGQTSSRHAHIAPKTSLDQQISSVGNNLASTHVAASSSISSPRTKSVLDSTLHATGAAASGATIVPDRFNAFYAHLVLVHKAGPGFTIMASTSTSIFSDVQHNVHTATLQNIPAVRPSRARLSLPTSSQTSSSSRNVEVVTRTSTTTFSAVLILAATATALVATLVISKHLEASATLLILCLVASICRAVGSTSTWTDRSVMNIFVSSSIWSIWSNMKQRLERDQRTSKDIHSGIHIASSKPNGETMKRFCQRVFI